MGSREKYEVPDWVVDDYNSRVSKEDRLPLQGSMADKYEDEYSSGYKFQQKHADSIYAERRRKYDTPTSSEWPKPIANGCATIVILFFIASFYFFVL